VIEMIRKTLTGFTSRRWSAVASAGVAIAALAAGQLVAAAPAHASAAQKVISGSGIVTDDFGDEATLSRTGQYRHSNAVALWQEILQSEGLYSGAIDCDFGPGTEAATKAYQSRYKLGVDGVVGPQTWSWADNKLVNEGAYESPQWETVYYSSNYGGSPIFRRLTSNGYYQLYLPSGGYWVTAFDNYASC
jgi:peptidoglycan hydrolase-like protein with peptidoglycan-binding domain